MPYHIIVFYDNQFRVYIARNAIFHEIKNLIEVNYYLHIARNPIFHERKKLIEVNYHF